MVTREIKCWRGSFGFHRGQEHGRDVGEDSEKQRKKWSVIRWRKNADSDGGRGVLQYGRWHTGSERPVEDEASKTDRVKWKRTFLKMGYESSNGITFPLWIQFVPWDQTPKWREWIFNLHLPAPMNIITHITNYTPCIFCEGKKHTKKETYLFINIVHILYIF